MTVHAMLGAGFGLQFNFDFVFVFFCFLLFLFFVVVAAFILLSLALWCVRRNDISGTCSTAIRFIDSPPHASNRIT